MSIKSRAIRTIGPLGGYRVARWVSRRIPKILMYHRFSEQPRPGYVDRGAFEKQLAYLKKHFRVMRLDQVLDVMSEPEGGMDNTVVITIDDGYRDFYEIAYPVLRQYQMPATLFLTTHFVDGNLWLWPDRIRYILQQSARLSALEVPGLAGGFKQELNDRMRDILWQRITSYLLSISEREKLAWMDNFAIQQGVSIPEIPVDEFSAVDWTQVSEMMEGNIEMGAHSRTHPSLGRVDGERLAYEILGSVEDIEQHGGRRPVSFCYPNGQPGDFTDEIKTQVRQAGCKGAVTAFYDSNVMGDLYELRRFTASEKSFQFEKSVNGVELIAARWLHVSSASPGQVC
jgi:peptidoglycan/xylan/chitin deacetylase (PgdA/CDA1 family)